jgi:hypothetical protein
MGHAFPYITRNCPDAVSTTTMGPAQSPNAPALTCTSFHLHSLSSQSRYHATKRALACRYWTPCSGDSRLPVALRYQALHFSLGSHPCRQPRNLTTLSPCGTAMKTRAPSGFWTPPPSLAPGPLPKTFPLGTRPYPRRSWEFAGSAPFGKCVPHGTRTHTRRIT